MPQDEAAETGAPGEVGVGSGGSRAELSGSAGDVVQARNVHGGVHFHRTPPADSTVPQQLPGVPPGFINRAEELARLDELLTTTGGQQGEQDRPAEAPGVCVIAGTAGVGKTSLALHWAHRVLRESFPDGQLYVNLRGYDPGAPVSPARALEHFLRALSVPPAHIPAETEDKAALYRSKLAGKRLLVFLDNAADVAQVRPLVPGTPSCLVVVTSRSRLSGLVARDGARRLTLDTLTQAESVDLLRSAMSAYRDGDSAEDLAELARLCARLPLALRIAAERAASRPWMPLRELIGDLRDESALWDALTSENGEESDAVRSVFAWSYRALPDEAARLFRLLGLHPGAEFDAASAMALTGTSRRRTRHLLDVLVGAHLLEVTASGRYQFHDLLRAYAVDQVNREEGPESREWALRGLLQWYLHTADAAAGAESTLRRVPLDPPAAGLLPLSFADYDAAIDWYEREQDNLTAVTRAAAEAGFDRIAWQLHAVLRTIYSHQNPFTDWLETGRIALDAARRLGDRRGEAEVRDSLGMAYTQSQQPRHGVEHHSAALALREGSGDRFGRARSLNGLGLLHLRLHELRQARARFEESTASFHSEGDAFWESVTRCNLAETYCELEQFQEAVASLPRVLAFFEDAGDPGTVGNALRCLSQAHRGLGDEVEASRAAHRAVDIAQDHRNHMWEGYWLIELGRVHLLGGRPGEALTAFHRAATLQRRLGDRSRQARALDGAGEAYQILGRHEEAVHFHRMASATHRDLDDRWQLAVSLDNLAHALLEAEDEAGARAAWREAASATAGFDDPAATRLHGQAREGAAP